MSVFRGIKQETDEKGVSYMVFRLDGCFEDVPGFVDSLTYALRKIALSEDIDEQAIINISLLIDAMQLNDEQMFEFQQLKK